MPLKKYQNPKGGLNAAGRAFYKRSEGSNLKAPVKGAAAGPEHIRRKASFLARMAGNSGPDFDEKGRPTRKLLSLRAWGASSTADAKKKAATLSARYKRMKESKK
jgi:hypothetical protein